MAHTKACAEAKGRVCNCSGCGGSEHGWVGGLALAAPERSKDRHQWHVALNKDWQTHYVKKKRRPNQRNRALAVDFSRLGSIEWLARDWASRAPRPNEMTSKLPADRAIGAPTTTTSESDRISPKEFRKDDIVEPVIAHQVNKLGDSITKRTLKAIDKAAERSGISQARKELTNHFWCDLFATFAQAVKQFESTLEKIPEWVVGSLLSSSHQSHRPSIVDHILHVAVTQAWKPIKAAIEETLGHDQALFSLQILAVLSCPAPEKHPEVFNHCLTPLVTSILEEGVKEKLRAAFPEKFSEETH